MSNFYGGVSSIARVDRFFFLLSIKVFAETRDKVRSRRDLGRRSLFVRDVSFFSSFANIYLAPEEVDIGARLFLLYLSLSKSNHSCVLPKSDLN